MSKLCPSAQPVMNQCRICQPAGGATATPLKPTDVFRPAAAREELTCPHFDGTDCRLAARIVQILPAVVDALPPRIIGEEGRWHSQEGAEAYKRCPKVTTVNYNLLLRMGEYRGCRSNTNRPNMLRP